MQLPHRGTDVVDVPHGKLTVPAPLSHLTFLHCTAPMSPPPPPQLCPTVEARASMPGAERSETLQGLRKPLRRPKGLSR